LKNLKRKLLDIDNGRFSKIIKAVVVKDICSECFYFMPTITDSMHGYRCRCIPNCIAATLHPHLQSYFWWKLGIIGSKEHKVNLGLQNVK
jgi:hypothetical protein